MINEIKTYITAECDRSLTIPNGKIEWGYTTTTPGSTVAVVCDNGYELVGGSALECRGDGTWTDSVSCQTTGKPLSQRQNYDHLLFPD